MAELTFFTAELDLSLRIPRPHHLGIMKVLVQTQGYLTLVANHRKHLSGLSLHDFNMKFSLPDSRHFVIPSSPNTSPHRTR